MSPEARRHLRVELTSALEQSRANYQRLKAANQAIGWAELSEARAAYERALVRLSRFNNGDRSGDGA